MPSFKRTIQDFDAWNWGLKGTTTEFALGRRTIAILPSEIGGNGVSGYRNLKINVERKGVLGALFGSSTPPKSVYAQRWENPKDWIGAFVPTGSKLPQSKQILQILTEAFTNGPPISCTNVHYGPNIVASAIFYPKDFEGPLDSAGTTINDEWKTVFFNTLRNKYTVLMKTPFMQLDHSLLNSEVYNMVGVVKIAVAQNENKKEYMWIWKDDCGIFLLSVVNDDNESIGREFLQQLDVEKEKAISTAFEKGKEGKEALLKKIDYFLANCIEK